MDTESLRTDLEKDSIYFVYYYDQEYAQFNFIGCTQKKETAEIYKNDAASVFKIKYRFDVGPKKEKHVVVLDQKNLFVKNIITVMIEFFYNKTDIFLDIK